MSKVPFRVTSFKYHEVVDNPRESGFQSPGAELWKHSTADFVRDLDIILVKRPLIKLVTDIDLTKPGDHILLTFDDGGKSAMRIAQILSEKNVKAHFFIITSLIDTPCFLSKSAVKELHQQGHIIGSHSHTHPSYCPELTLSQMQDEWKRSVFILSGILDCPVITGSIPNGFRCSNTIDSAGQAGIKYLFTSDFTVKPWWFKEVLCLGGVCPQRHTSPRKIRNCSNFKGIAADRAYIQLKQMIKWLIWPIYKKR